MKPRTEREIQQTAAFHLSESGFSTLENFFSDAELENFEECVVELYLLQAQKIGEYRDEAFRLKIVGYLTSKNFAQCMK